MTEFPRFPKEHAHSWFPLGEPVSVSLGLISKSLSISHVASVQLCRTRTSFTFVIFICDTSVIDELSGKVRLVHLFANMCCGCILDVVECASLKCKFTANIADLFKAGFFHRENAVQHVPLRLPSLNQSTLFLWLWGLSRLQWSDLSRAGSLPAGGKTTAGYFSQ